MKLRTRLAVAFLTITIVPMLLFYLLVLALSNYQTRSFTKEYGLTEQVDLFSGNSMQIFNRITKALPGGHQKYTGQRSGALQRFIISG